MLRRKEPAAPPPKAAQQLPSCPVDHSMDEDEQIRLAEELSFASEFDLIFDPKNIADVRMRLQRLEEMLNEYILMNLNDEVHETMSLGSFNSHGHLHLLEKEERNRELSANESLDSILRGLRWYQSKIVVEIQNSTEEATLSVMLDLNDRVSSVIARAEEMQREPSMVHHLDGPPEVEETPLSLTGSPLPSLTVSEREPFSRSRRAASSSTPTNAALAKSPSLTSQDRFSAIMSAVYAVRRGQSQEETITALQSLACLAGLSDDGNRSLSTSDPNQLCGEKEQAALREMSVAGALPALLCARQRAEQWPEAEMLLCKLVAMIASFETDLALLQRSSSALLEMLYMLQVKSQHIQKERGLDEKTSIELMEMRALISSTAAKVALALASQWRELGNRREDSPLSSSLPRRERERDSYTVRGRRENERDRELERERDKEDELLGQLQALLSVLRLVCEDSETSVECSPDIVFSCNHWDDVFLEEQETDEYLRRRFSLSLSDLLLGCVSPAVIKQRESANVLASFALLTLCEVTRAQCLAALVSHGALTLLQSWLYKSLSLAKALRSVCAISSRRCDGQGAGNRESINASHLSESIFQLFGPSIELLHNASRAFLLLCESSSKRTTQSSTSQSAVLTSSQSLPLSTVQVEDALLSSSVGETIGRLLNVAAGMQEDAPNGTDMPILHSQVFRSVLPVSVTALLTQSLLRLISLSLNRSLAPTSTQFVVSTGQPLCLSPLLSLSLCFTLQSTLAQWKTFKDGPQCADDDGDCIVLEGELLLRSLYARLFTLKSIAMSYCGAKETYHEMDDVDGVKSKHRLKKAMKTEDQADAPCNKEHDMIQSCVCAVVTSSMNSLLLSLNELDRERDKERDRMSTRGRTLSSATPSLQLPSTAQPVTNASVVPLSSGPPMSLLVLSPAMLLTRGSLASSLLQSLSQLSRGPGRLAALSVIATLCEKREKDSLTIHILLEAGVLHALLSLLNDIVGELEQERQRVIDRHVDMDKDRMRERHGREKERASDNERISERASEDSSFSLRSISLSLPLPLSLSRGRSDGRTTPSSVRSITKRRDREREHMRTTERDRLSERASERGGRTSVERDWEEFWLEESVWSDKDRDDSDCEGANNCSTRARECKDFERERIREQREESKFILQALRAAISDANATDDSGALRCLRVLQDSGLSLLLARVSLAIHSLAVVQTTSTSLSSASLAMSPTSASPSTQQQSTVQQVLSLSDAESESLCSALRALSIALSHSKQSSRSNSSAIANNTNSNSQSARKLEREDNFAHLLIALLGEQNLLLPENVLQESLSLCSTLVRRDREQRQRVVTHCLRTVCGSAVNPSVQRETRIRGERVLVALGFVQGRKDLELCGYDTALLRDWHSLRESEIPQQRALCIVRDWERRLFGTSKSMMLLNSSDSDRNRQSIQKASSAQREYESEEALLSQRQKEIPEKALSLVLEIANHLQIDGESLSLTLTQQRRSQILQPHVHQRGALMPTHTPSVGESVSNWQRNLSHSLSRLLPFCRVEKEDHDASAQSSEVAVRGQTMDRSHVVGVPPSPHSPASITNGGIAMSAFSVDSNGTAAGASSSTAHASSAMTISTAALQAAVAQDRYLWIDRVPLRAQKVLDLFHESLLLQRLILGLHLLGKSVKLITFLSQEGTSSAIIATAATSTSTTSNQSEIAVAVPAGDYTERETEHYLFPTAARLHAIQLPHRTYQTFTRVGRVLHRLVREVQRASSNTNNSNTTNVTSLSIDGDSDEDDDDVDNLDSDFEEDVSPCDSPHDIDERDTNIDQQFALCFRDSVFEGDFHDSLLFALRQCCQVNCLSFHSQEVVEEEAQLGLMVSGLPPSVRFVSFSRTLSRDSVLAMAIQLRQKCQLNGLALLRVSLSTDDKALHAVADLLASSASATAINANTSQSGRLSITSSLNSPAASHLLRHIDLSHNGLSDSQCALLLKSALLGSIESLELAGNEIHRATQFISTLEREREGQLRYLGVSENHLTQHAVCELLVALKKNSTLVHLSLAHNLLESAKNTHIAFADFLANNHSLRTLDLSHNRLSSESYKSLCLSVLENSSLLLLSLQGNPSAEHSHSVSLIQKKLRENRMAYKSLSRKWTDKFCMSDEDMDREVYRLKEIERATQHRCQQNIREKQRLLNEQVDAQSSNNQTMMNSLPIATAVVSDSSNVNCAANCVSDSNSTTFVTTEKVNVEREVNIADTLCVLFSAPLAGFDRQSKAHPLEVLDYVSERETLVQVFRETSRDVALHFDFATTDTLRTMLSLGCRALHFSGHGLAKGLCFEDGRAGLHIVQVSQLSELLSAGGLTLELVFVSACYSRAIGETFVQAGVQHVVCVNVESQIQDTAAIAFTRAFYIALLSGKTVRQSFDIGKQALINSPSVTNSTTEGEKFILLPDNNKLQSNDNNNKAIAVDRHAREVFPSRERISQWPRAGMCTVGAQHTDLSLALSRHRLPAMPPDFEGREVALNALVRSLLEKRLVSLVGREGEGKSAVAIALTHYLADRDKFDAFVCVRAKGIRDFHSLVYEVQQTMLSCGNNAVSRAAQSLFPSSITRRELQRRISSSADSLNLAGSLIANNDSSMLLNNNNLNNANNNMTSNSDRDADTQSLVRAEELIFRAIENTKTLLVLDHLDDLLADFASDATTDMRLFLSRLFEQCPHVRVLNVSCDSLQMRYVQLPHIIEHSYALPSLTMHSSLRLFARLAPSLSTAQAKSEFVFALQPPKQQNVTAGSREASTASRLVFDRLGGGHAARIVHLACESSDESVHELRVFGLRLNHPALFDQLTAMHNSMSSNSGNNSNNNNTNNDNNNSSNTMTNNSSNTVSIHSTSGSSTNIHIVDSNMSNKNIDTTSANINTTTNNNSNNHVVRSLHSQQTMHSSNSSHG